ncbi:MAG: hypothetical protein ACI87F_000104 [Candidatus Azotimanducaceae bacterium]|jgi:hypothetical protein
MKKILTIILTIVLFTSCNDFGDVNVSQKSPAEVPGETLFTAATKSMVDQMVSTNVNTNIMKLFSQYWTETTYTDEANYDFGRDQPGSHWDEIYRDVLRDLKESRDLLNVTDDGTSPVQRANQMASIEIMEVYAYHVLVDSFGDVPFTEAMDITILNPVYDDDAAVYSAIIIALDAAIAKLNVSEPGFTGGADLLFDGDASGWKKFANSLKLRMAVRIAGVDAGKAATMASQAVASGVFTSNSDNVSLQYLSAPPNTNPIWEDLVQSGRADFVGTNTMIDIMNTLDDGRRSVYFQENMGTDTFVGGIYGENNNYADYSHAGDLFHTETLEGIILDYSEVEFLLAEAAELSLVGTPGDAEGHYNAGITASFDYWEADMTGYLAQVEVDYSTATGTWQQKIATQKWLALYNRGFEGWSTYRKYGYPMMNIPPVSLEAVPNRYTYPQDEPSLNNTNWAAAMGGSDLKSTLIFWDN